MHPSAYNNCEEFYKTYHTPLLEIDHDYRILEIGSLNINGSMRPIFPPGIDYVGIDSCEGKDVDIVIEDPYKFPFDNESVDIVLCSSVFEHCDMFWVLFLEIMRVLKPHGLFYLNAPSNGDIHYHPVDCWRFYPDSGKAMVKWANLNGYNSEILESYTSAKNKDIWNDYVAVFLKNKEFVSKYHKRILDIKEDFWNGYRNDNEEILKPTSMTQDQKQLEVIRKVIIDEIKVL